MANRVTDTLEFYKQLTRAGLPEAQAEVFAANQADISGELVDVNHRLDLMSRDLTVRFGAMVAAGAIATIGIILSVVLHLVPVQ